MRSWAASLPAIAVAACGLATEGLTPETTGETTTTSATGGTAGAGGDASAVASTGTAGATSTSGGATTGAAGGGSATGTSTSTGGGGAGGAPVEACGNDADDDGDTFVDCADPDCVAAGFTCVRVPAVASELARLVGPGASCPAGYTKTQPGSCVGCGCNVVAQGSCHLEVKLYASAGCAGEADTIEVGGGCAQDVSENDGSVDGAALPNEDATCAPSGGPVVASVTLCAAEPVPGGCAPMQACAPPEVDCVVLDSGPPCPDTFPFATVISEDQVSACGACACSTAQTCPIVQYEVWGDNNSCQANGSVATTTGMCAPLGLGSKHSIKPPPPPIDAAAACVAYSVPAGVTVRTVCCKS